MYVTPPRAVIVTLRWSVVVGVTIFIPASQCKSPPPCGCHAGLIKFLAPRPSCLAVIVHDKPSVVFGVTILILLSLFQVRRPSCATNRAKGLLHLPPPPTITCGDGVCKPFVCRWHNTFHSTLSIIGISGICPPGTHRLGKTRGYSVRGIHHVPVIIIVV